MEAIKEFRYEFAGYSSSAILALLKEKAEFRTRIEALYRRYFRRSLNLGCSSCWVDAYALLMRYPIDQLTAMKNCLFELKAGALLVDVVRGANDKMCTRHNLTDELALYHLRTNPACIRLFARYPDNWESLAQGAAPPIEEDGDTATLVAKPRKKKKKK